MGGGLCIPSIHANFILHFTSCLPCHRDSMPFRVSPDPFPPISSTLPVVPPGGVTPEEFSAYMRALPPPGKIEPKRLAKHFKEKLGMEVTRKMFTDMLGRLTDSEIQGGKVYVALKPAFKMLGQGGGAAAAGP